jgi:hypothetical protein
MEQRSIFVQIPAYRDSELEPTLRDLYERADRPDHVRTCVVWQYAPGEALADDVLRLPGLEIVPIPLARSRGCNWARRIGQRAWRGEPYTLLLDSHHRFVDGWDTAAVDMHRQLLDGGVARPMLTAYLPAYEPELDPHGRGTAPYKIYPLSREQGLLLRLTSQPILWHESLTAPVKAEFLSLHFIFTDGRFNQDVPIDPKLYFFGDEVMVGFRAFAAGFDLYHPHVVLGWHAYSRTRRAGHWDDHPDWRRRHEDSLAHMRLELTSARPGPGGRTREDYERHAMVTLVQP